jgi:hypothetical protein
MFTGLVGPHGRGVPGFRFHSPVGPIARASLGSSACWAGHCQSQPCQASNRDLRLHGVAIVVLPAGPIDAATVVDPVASVVVAAMAAEVAMGAVAMGAVIAVRLRPVQPVPSVGPLLIVHQVIAHSGIVHQAIVPSRIVPLRIAPLVVVLSVTDLLAIGPSGTERERRATVVQASSPVTAPRGQMPAGHSPVLPVRNAARNHPARTSFGGLGLLK